MDVTRTTTETTIVRAVVIGIAAGLRSQVPNAVLALNRESAPRGAAWTGWIPFRWSGARVPLALGAAGEMIGDKTSMAPPRTDPGPLVGRIVLGGFAGAALGSRGEDGDILIGAVCGALGSTVGSYGGYHVRRLLTKVRGVPDLPVALAEDALAVKLSWWAVQQD